MIYIGIDPDIEASGIAIWDSSDKKFSQIDLISFYDLYNLIMRYRREYNDSLDSIYVMLEAGFLNKKSQWHNNSTNILIRERIAKNVGQNHAVGMLLQQLLIRSDISYNLVKPMGKVSNDTFRLITGVTKKLTQDEIDAAMLVYGL